MEALLYLVALSGVTAAVVFALLFRRTYKSLEGRTAENDSLREQVDTRDDRIAELARFERIVDAESHAAMLIASGENEAQLRMTRAREGATQLLLEAERQRAELAASQSIAHSRALAELERVRNEAALDRQRGSEVARAARDNAAAIVDEARLRAAQVESSAQDALARAAEMERQASALRNVVEGYGNRYLLPSAALLDDLAEEFGFSEAGKNLKEARQRMRQLIKDDRASACDYAEEARKQTAMRFVLDAFNGKADSVLADVGDDNLGTLCQRLQDAFTIVNQHGQAFRNARISDEYLSARLDELKWGVITQALRTKEREEQRALKERIREEERAQREFERAMKEAAREEDLLRGAMEKAQREIAKATDAQRATYESQLAALAERLRLAEEKRERARSMAEQTRAGHVYVISNVGSFGENVYKIGLTRRIDPMDRIHELGDASVPFDFDVHALMRSENAPALERELHRRFVSSQVNKVNPRKEFFRTSIQEIKKVAESLGCETSWTMSAECRDYQETLAVERALQNSAIDETAWVDRQLREHDEMLRTQVLTAVET